MIKDNLLADKLNKFRNDGQTSEEESQEYINQMDVIDDNVSLAVKISAEIIELGYIFTKSIAYGLALNTVFSQDWNFISMLAIGFSLEMILSSIFGLFTRNI